MWQFACPRAINTPHLFMHVTGRIFIEETRILVKIKIKIKKLYLTSRFLTDNIIGMNFIFVDFIDV